MQSQHYHRNRAINLVFALGAAALLLGAIIFARWGMLNPEALVELMHQSPGRGNPVVALPLSLIMAPVLLALVIYHGMRAADRRPLLILSQEGLFYRDWRTGVIPWQEVEDCIVVVHERDGAFGWRPRDIFIEVHLRHPQPYLENVHGRAKFTEDYKHSYFRIPMRGIRAKHLELWHAVMTRIMEPGKIPPSGPHVETVRV